MVFLLDSQCHGLAYIVIIICKPQLDGLQHAEHSRWNSCLFLLASQVSMPMAVVMQSHRWLPEHRATAIFLFIAGVAPESIAQLYASKRMEAQGQFQMYYHTRPAYALGHLSMKMRLLYGAHAWTNQVVALMMPIWVAVPIIQIIFGVFPFDPNRSDKL